MGRLVIGPVDPGSPRIGVHDTERGRVLFPLPGRAHSPRAPAEDRQAAAGEPPPPCGHC